MYIASLVMGIVSLLLSWIPVLGFIIAIAALIIAIIAMVIKNPENKGKKMEIAGLILSIVAILISLAVIILPLLMIGAVVDAGTELIDEVVTEGIDLVDDATNELGSMSSSLQNQIIQSYDNKILSGTQVRAAVMQYMTSTDMTVVLMNSDETKMIATVGAKQLADGSVTAKTGFYEIELDNYSAEGGDLHKTLITDFTNPQSETAINMVKNYKSYLLKIAGTDNVVGIVFAEQQ